jgi:glutamyl-tRNA synthetase
LHLLRQELYISVASEPPFTITYTRRKTGGKFLLRIEDTDQNRFVPGAEEYIKDALDWLGISPDESPWNPAESAPYRQSERKPMYMQYALDLIEKGHAYYAFDTSEELDAMRERLTAARVVSPTV